MLIFGRASPEAQFHNAAVGKKELLVRSERIAPYPEGTSCTDLPVAPEDPAPAALSILGLARRG